MKFRSLTIALLSLASMLLLVAGPTFAQSRKERDEAKKFKEAATIAIRQKNFRAAADSYGKALALVPNDSDALYRKGFAHYSLKENDNAIRDLSTALDKGFKPALDIYRIRHFVYFDQKNYDAALADVQKGLQIAPNDVEFLSRLGEIQMERRAFPEALAAVEKASNASPNNADLYYTKSRVFAATGDAKGQADSAATALGKGTRYPAEAYLLLGDASQKLQKPDAAIDAYQKSINARPDNLQAYRTLSEIYRSENRFDDAIRASKLGLMAFPANGELFIDLGLYYSLAERDKDAIEAGRSAVGLLPNNYSGHTNLCRAYNETKEFSLAIGTCNRALHLKPGDGETLFYLGRAQTGANKKADAAKTFAQAVTGLLSTTVANPRSSEAWYLLGNAYFSDTKYDQAIDAYMKSIAISPKFAKARYNLAVIYTNFRKNKEKAVEQYDRIAPVDTRLAGLLRKEIDKM
ncbi:MAG: tetratricopeptide repeat protein [Pyrinomonadaceae bacterium]